MKRVFDIIVSLFGLICASPLLLPVIFLVWKQDGKNPFYIATRVGKNEKPFDMVKLRSMVVDADKTGVASTSNNDMRITPIGHFIRKYKMDELTQLWNVLKGDMSLVGPRPNVKDETDLYTKVEKGLLVARPGITDFASIVFSDEGDILEGKNDPDLAYNQLIRPWKSRLGLIYIKHQSISLDLQLILYTVIAILSKQKALNWIVKQLQKMGINGVVVGVAKRDKELMAFAPPGSDEIVRNR